MNEVFQQTRKRSENARKRISSMIYRTPLLPSRRIGEATGCDLRFKAENFQLTGSFKMRGAASKLTSITPASKLIAASSGNHGIAAARAASLTGHDLLVVLPETVTTMKLETIRAFGVEVELHGSNPGLAEAYAREISIERGHTYIPPYNDPDVIAGQGTIALELEEQCEAIDNVFVAMGGGGLISGVGSALKASGAHTRIYGVSARNSAALAAALEAGRVVETTHSKTLADGVAGAIDNDTMTLEIADQVIDVVLHCDEFEIASALKRIAREENMLVEGAAALALAGFLKVAEQLKGQTSVVLLCGANFDEDRVLPLIV